MRYATAYKDEPGSIYNDDQLKIMKGRGNKKRERVSDTRVTAPARWQSSPDHPETSLAYITDEEMGLLQNLDLHNSGVDEEMHYGPKGIVSLNGVGGPAGDYGGNEGADGGGRGGGHGASGGGSASGGDDGNGGTGSSGGGDSNGGGIGGNGEGNGGEAGGDNGSEAGGPGAGDGSSGGMGEADVGNPGANADIGQDQGTAQANADAKGDVQGQSIGGKTSADTPGPANAASTNAAFGMEEASVAQGLSAVSGRQGPADGPSNMGLGMSSAIGRASQQGFAMGPESVAAARGLHGFSATDVPAPDPAEVAAPSPNSALGQTIGDVVSGKIGATEVADALGPMGTPPGALGVAPGIATANIGQFGQPSNTMGQFGLDQASVPGQAAAHAAAQRGKIGGRVGDEANKGAIADAISQGFANVEDPGFQAPTAAPTAPQAPTAPSVQAPTAPAPTAPAPPGLTPAQQQREDAITSVLSLIAEPPGVVKGWASAVEGRASQAAVDGKYGGISGGEDGERYGGNARGNGRDKAKYPSTWIPDWWKNWRADHGKFGLLGETPYAGLI